MPPRPKRLSRPPNPFSVIPLERAYVRKLKALIKKLKPEFMALIRAHDPSIRAAIREQTPAPLRKDDAASEIERLISGLRLVLAREWSETELREIARTQGQSINETVKRSVDNQWKRVLGLNPIQDDRRLQEFLRAKANEQVTLIKTIPERHFPQLATGFLNAYERGASIDALGEFLSDRFDLMGFEAERIARTETGKLNSALTQYRQTELGVEKYRWLTARDERVRLSHLHMETEDVGFGPGIFRWDDPPFVDDNFGAHHPGDAINCRCIALPVIE